MAKDRRIGAADTDMRHGRKSRAVRFDGYKRHVLTDLDTGLIAAVGITPANVPEAAVTDAITADLAAQQATMSSAIEPPGAASHNGAGRRHAGRTAPRKQRDHAGHA